MAAPVPSSSSGAAGSSALPQEEIILTLSDSLKRSLRYGGPNNRAVVYFKRHRGKFTLRKSFPWLHEEPASGARFFQGVFGGWDPVKEGFSREIIGLVDNLLDGTPNGQVSQVWVVLGINSIRDDLKTILTEDVYESLMEETSLAIVDTLKGIRQRFQNARVTFLGSGRIYERVRREDEEDPLALEQVNKMARDVFECVATATAEARGEREGKGDGQLRPEAIPLAYDCFQGWRDEYIDDKFGHLSKRGCRAFFENLRAGPGRQYL